MYESAQDVPHRVLDVLRTFLAASSRGEQTVLVLETRNCTLTKKYRNVETVAGAPASSPTNRKKVNPARAKSSGRKWKTRKHLEPQLVTRKTTLRGTTWWTPPRRPRS